MSQFTPNSRSFYITSTVLTSLSIIIKTGEENNSSPQRKKSEAECLSPKLSRAATTIAEEAVDQLQASEKLIAGELV